MKIFSLFILIFILAGCIPRSEIMHSWVGQTESKLVASWGAPDGIFTTTEGKKVLTWKNVWSDGGGVHTCVQSFTVDQNGIVEKWSSHGCEHYYLKF